MAELSKKELYEEEKAKRLALKEKELKQAQKKQAKKEYKNPVNTLLGKILVITLSVAMLFGVIAGVIFALINAA